jgi:hypothetical protein
MTVDMFLPQADGNAARSRDLKLDLATSYWWVTGGSTSLPSGRGCAHSSPSSARWA